MSGCSARLVPLTEVDARLRGAWAELAEAAVEPNPFFAPEVLLPAAALLPGGSQVRLLTVHRDGALVLAVPVRRERYRRVPLPAASTWRHPYRYLGTPLVHPDALDDAAAALLWALRRVTSWLVMEQLYVDGPVARALRDAARTAGAVWTEQDVWERPYVHARDTETYLEHTLSARSAKTLRRLRRGLERERGPVRACDVAAATRDLDAELDAFLALEAAGWKGRAGTALASRPADADFFRAAGRALAAQGRLELWQLQAGDTVVARQCHLRSGDTVFHWKTAYDEQAGRWSPGVLLELDVLSAFHADPQLARLDPCTDDEPGTSARLYPDTRRLGVALVGLTPLGRLAARTAPVALRTWRAVRR